MGLELDVTHFLALLDNGIYLANIKNLSSKFCVYSSSCSIMQHHS